MRLDDWSDTPGTLRAGEVIELVSRSEAQLVSQVEKCAPELAAQHLTAVPLSKLMRDAGVPV